MATPTTPQPLGPLPEHIKLGHVELRRWQLCDAQAQFAAAESSLSELRKWMIWAANGYTLENARCFLEFTHDQWDKGKQFDYAIVVDGQVCGSMGLAVQFDKAPGTLDLGYWLATSKTGRGIVSCAAAALARAAFHSGTEYVQIRNDKNNRKSGAVPQRLGFTCLGLVPPPKGSPSGDEEFLWQMHRVDVGKLPADKSLP